MIANPTVWTGRRTLTRDDEPATAPARKTNAAEVLAGLRDDVGLMAARLDDVADFARKAKAALLKDADVHRAEGMLLPLQILFRVHDIVYRHESDGVEDDPAREFAGSIRATIESELRGAGVGVIGPKPGTPFDRARMKVLAAEGDTGGESATVTRVHRCGFQLTMGGHTDTLRKAEVDIART